MASGRKTPADAPRRFRRREVELAAGGKLVLNADGSIEQSGADGTVVGTWKTGDDDWARHAVRFGLKPPSETVVPPGRRDREPFIR